MKLFFKFKKLFEFAVVRKSELERLRGSEKTWRLAIESLERHNELMRKETGKGFFFLTF